LNIFDLVIGGSSVNDSNLDLDKDNWPFTRSIEFDEVQDDIVIMIEKRKMICIIGF